MMKTLLIIGCLIALVWIGVANSPKMETPPIGSVAESVYVAGAVLHDRVLTNEAIAERYADMDAHD